MSKVIKENSTNLDDIIHGKRDGDTLINHKDELSPKRKSTPPKYILNGGKLTFSDNDFTTWLEKVKRTTGTDDDDLAVVLAIQLGSAILDDKTSVRAVNAAIAMMHGIQPRDELEAMLATQMVAVHHIAMQMSSRCVCTDQNTDFINANINSVTRLMRTFTEQIESLNRYRGKGQQKVTVEHVHVNEGGKL
jgi:hypothetical protein